MPLPTDHASIQTPVNSSVAGADSGVSDEHLLNGVANSTSVSPPRWLTEIDSSSFGGHAHRLPASTRIIKRLTDILVASGLLLVATPVMLLAAMAIKCNSPGPVVFTQTRVGLNNRRDSGRRASWLPIPICRRRKSNYGRPFTIFKLRTMHVEASSNGPTQTQKQDARIFPVGRLLRRMRIDELPQLLNVLRGEMSMVGPRPECIEYMEDLSAKVPNYLERLGLKPGLTGIAQIESGYANDLESYRRKVTLDLLYLQNCCPWNDLKIMVRTGRVIFSGFGAL